MKVTKTEYEGTPEELKLAGILPSLPEAREFGRSTLVANVAREETQVGSELLKRALARIPLSQNQAKVLKVIAHADPSVGIATGEVAERVGLTVGQLAGVMGALGRRWIGTRGWPEGVSPYSMRWEANIRQVRYWPTPVLRDWVK